MKKKPLEVVGPPCCDKCANSHALHLIGDGAQLTVVRGSGKTNRGAYLWVGDGDDKFVGAIEGVEALAQLRDVISELLGDER